MNRKDMKTGRKKSMNGIAWLTSLLIMLIVLLSGCGVSGSEEKQKADNTDTAQQEQISDTEGEEVTTYRKLILKIDGETVPVEWEDNESVAALRELAEDGLEINTSRYGGFEQVGDIESSLPRNDKDITTDAGDIMLYAGSNIVLFYGSNSWAYTRLGKIGLTEKEIKELLGNNDVTITLSVE